MGKLAKIEVDDKFPVTIDNHVFAKSEFKDEIWPFIFSKAICKLLAYKWDGIKNFNFESLVGDGSVMYSLTGLIPETMRIDRML